MGEFSCDQQDPTAQLEQLRRNSLIGPSDLKLPAKRAVPDRKMVGSSAPPVWEQDGPPSAAQTAPDGLAMGGTATEASGKVVFAEPGFGKDGDVKKVEDLLSPTETAS